MFGSKAISGRFANTSDMILWLMVFIITALIIALVQLVMLPFIFPAWHAGDGLLIGGDWIGFHQEAVELANRINTEGWAEWELRPKGWMPSGVAGAIYALSWPKPWTLIPLNAAVHATTFLVVMKILLLFSSSRLTAFIAALPFAFFPSAMLWYTQIHRDGYQVLGTVCFIYGILFIISAENKVWSSCLRGLFLAVLGVIVIWLVRPHSILILQYMLLILTLIIVIAYVIMIFSKKAMLSAVIIQLAFIALLVAVVFPLTQTDGVSKYQFNLVENNGNKSVGEEEKHLEQTGEYYWEKVFWLPQAIDNQLYSIAYHRVVIYQKKYGETASGIDYDKAFHSAYDFIFYLPRALQISFLAPFPSEWFGEGSLGSTTFFRRVSAVEMLFIYIIMPFMLYAIYKWRKKLEMWILVIFCTVMMLPMVYSVPNVGTIYRYRYGYLMLLVGIGLTVLIDHIRHVKANR